MPPGRDPHGCGRPQGGARPARSAQRTAAGRGCTDYHLTGKIRALVETSTRQSPLGNTLFFVSISPPS